MDTTTLDQIISADITGDATHTDVLYIASRAYLFPDGKRVAIDGAVKSPALALASARYALGSMEVDYLGVSIVDGHIYGRA